MLFSLGQQFYRSILNREKAWQQLHKDAVSYTEQILEATYHKTVGVQLSTTHLNDHPN